jgi:RimJ/RimL family protein N-acetyltransferase
LELLTDRLLIRDLVPYDWRAVHEYGSDPEVVRYMPWGPNTAEQTQEFLQRTVEQQKAAPRRAYEMAMILKDDGRLIGGVGLRVHGENADQGDIGYVLRRDLWGQGYVTEAARGMVGFGFKELRLHRIWATCDTRNVGSYRVMEKLGMRREAHHRQDVWLHGEWRDSYLYAILESEFKP